MKNKFVADGAGRFLRAKRAMAAEPIEQKYAAELANVGPDEKEKVRKRMAEEMAHRGKILNHKPSAGTLW